MALIEQRQQARADLLQTPAGERMCVALAHRQRLEFAAWGKQLRADPELAGVVADSGAYLCLMHMLGAPRTMQDNPVYEDVVSDIKAFLEERLAFAIAAGVQEEHICLDPGIGFGKTVQQNLELIRRLDELAALGRPLVIGFSRKSSLGRIVGDPTARTGSIAASLGAAISAYERGATLLRVHDVREHVEALAVAKAVAEG